MKKRRDVASFAPLVASVVAALSRIAPLLLALVGMGLHLAVGRVHAADGIDPSRVRQLAAWLPERPVGVGHPLDHRQAWQPLAEAPAFRSVVEQAESLLNEPIADLPDELYLDFSRTGNRTRYQRVLSQRRSRLSNLVLAECLENRGRFLPAIEEAVRAVCAEKTWVLPAHDRALENFRGEVVEIDLASSATSWNLATTVYWLGQRLSPQVRQLIQAELERRTFKPFESYVTGGQPRLHWATVTNNWNAVCLAGVVGAALAAIDPPERRAFFAAAAEHYIEYFLEGFTSDGYCSEGLGYWNYGFGHFALLAETLLQATGGELDLLGDPRAATIARFGVRMEMDAGVYPAFADCHLGSRPGPRLLAFLSRRFGWNLRELEERFLLASGGPSSALFEVGLWCFPNSATQRAPVGEQPYERGLRDWFPEAGVLICRPAQAGRGLAVAIKGGHNAEHHNHNDVGTFTVALAGQTPLVDPGSEVYTARTFSGRRYESNVLNSFGHPVPLVAGKQQRTGRAAAAKVIQTEFTDERDTLVLDLSAAYSVPELRRLVRTFVFSRHGAGSLTVTDEVEFSTAQSFGTALITFLPWNRDAARLLVGKSPAAVGVDLSADDTAGNPLPLEVNALEIQEDLPNRQTPTRLGIELLEPVQRAKVTLRITPLGN